MKYVKDFLYAAVFVTLFILIVKGMFKVLTYWTTELNAILVICGINMAFIFSVIINNKKDDNDKDDYSGITGNSDAAASTGNQTPQTEI